MLVRMKCALLMLREGQGEARNPVFQGQEQ